MLTMEEIAVPEPDLTPDELAARARALRDRVRAEAPAAEVAGRYSPELHRAFVEAGFFRILQPRRYGGYGFDLETFLRVTMTIAEGDLGTGWNLSLGSAHVLQVCAYFGEQAQDELFAHRDGYFSSPHRAAPEGTATKVEGGYRVTGRWAYSSGSPYGSHFIATSMGPLPDGRMAVLAPIVPMEQCTVVDDWGGDNSIGLRASGSNTVVVDDVFVPDHLVVDGNWLGAKHPPEGPQGFLVHKAPMYLGRTMTIYYGELAALLVGAARGSVAEFERLTREKSTPLPPIVPRIAVTRLPALAGAGAAQDERGGGARVHGRSPLPRARRAVHHRGRAVHDRRRRRAAQPRAAGAGAGHGGRRALLPEGGRQRDQAGLGARAGLPGCQPRSDPPGGEPRGRSRDEQPPPVGPRAGVHPLSG